MIHSIEALDCRFELPPGAGSDSLHVDPRYSYAVTLLHLSDGEYGTGLGFTLGRGNEVVCRAIEAYAPFVVGQELEAVARGLARFWRRLADESQLRWIGPQKGAIHLALSSITGAIVDAWARRQGKPLWRLLLEMDPEELIEWVDLAYLEDFLTREEAVALLRDRAAEPWEMHPLVRKGYPAYNTSVGWLGYDRETILRLCREQLAAGFGALKVKVGSTELSEDLERVAAVREAVGPEVRLMLDANQKWSVPEAIRAGRALAAFDPFWLEEPTHPDDLLGFQEIARAIAPVTVAGGEHVPNAVIFKNLIRAGAIRFVQADVVRLGGLPEYLAVCLMARKAGLPVVPHVGDMGQIHQHLVPWQAIRLGCEAYHLEYIPHLRDRFVTPIRVEGGRYRLPDEPGATTRLKAALGRSHCRAPSAASEASISLPQPFPRRMGPNAAKYVQEVVESGLACDMVGRFERAFAAACGVRHCIATPGCTPALHLAVMALGFDAGDEVVISSITDYGTLMGVVKENLIPVFADTEPGTVVVSDGCVRPCLTDRTRAILVVHKAGIICDMDPIVTLARRRGLVVIEDCCQAVFGRYRGRVAGTLGDIAAFSFDSEKTLGSDVGGCLITNDDALAERARFVGQSRGAVNRPGFGRLHTVAGNALRMPHCTAALCLAQLEIIEEQVEHLDRMARLLAALLAEIPGVTPTPIPESLERVSAWMVGFSIDPDAFTCTADAFGQACAEAGIPGAGTARYYLMPEACTFLEERARAGAYPYSRPPASRAYRYGGATCPNARRFLEHWIRWSSFCAKYEPRHCERAAAIVAEVAERYRR